MEKIYTIALGGNAILTNDPSQKGQIKEIERTVDYLQPILESPNKVVLTHGNGPQVGNLLLQQLGNNSQTNPAMPLDTCVAMTQGSIGYWLGSAIRNKIHNKPVMNLLTRVLVDEKDHAFANPTKPIGPFYSDLPTTEKGETYIEDSGRGYRRVVPSPKPKQIIEINEIKALTDSNQIVICCGGGGIPVIERDRRLIGVEAVIDKDLATAQLSIQIQSSVLLILTGVSHVYLNFNQPNQEKLTEVTSERIRMYLEQGQFPEGSMKPKIEAALLYLEHVKDGEVVITSLENIGNYLETGDATIIKNTI